MFPPKFTSNQYNKSDNLITQFVELTLTILLHFPLLNKDKAHFFYISSNSYALHSKNKYIQPLSHLQTPPKQRHLIRNSYIPDASYINTSFLPFSLTTTGFSFFFGNFLITPIRFFTSIIGSIVSLLFYFSACLRL